MNPTTIVTKSADPYHIYVENGWKEPLLSEIRRVSRGEIFLISQKGLENCVMSSLLEYLRPLFPNINPSDRLFYLEVGEENKHLDRLGSVYNWLLEKGADRKITILAVGGGVVGDFAGFVAATFQRGVDFIQLPSTLLAAVDSSVGGKVAVNVKYGKNMVGAFHQPRLVYFNSELLRTLPEKEWICGLAELLKHSFLQKSGTLLKILRGNAKNIRDTSSTELQRVLMESIRVKAEIVEEDEKELGARAFLNLGHTTAHSIESVTRYTRFSHGEAVSRGLVTMLLLSRRICGLSSESELEMIDLMREYLLPLDTAGLSAEDLYADMKYDKKSVSGEPKFVLLEERGRPVRDQRVSKELFRDAWEEQKSRFG